MKVLGYLKKGWHALESLHTAVWLYTLVGVSLSTATSTAVLTWFKNPANFGLLLIAQGVAWIAIVLLVIWSLGRKASEAEAIAGRPDAARTPGQGGRGGNASVVGNRSSAIGGPGGNGGMHGAGGDGGHATVQGDDSFAAGGAGGNAGTADGRGGTGAPGPMEWLGGPTNMWQFGRGGSSPNTPEYNRRMVLLTQIRREYMETFPERVSYIDAGIDLVPINWVNKRLEELGETWRVLGAPERGYVMPPLS